MVAFVTMEKHHGFCYSNGSNEDTRTRPEKEDEDASPQVEKWMLRVQKEKSQGSHMISDL